MRRIFTHLNSRLANDSFHPLRKAFFLEDPDCPTLVVNKQVEEQKVSGPSTPQETSSDLVDIYIYINLRNLRRKGNARSIR